MKQADHNLGEAPGCSSRHAWITNGVSCLVLLLASNLLTGCAALTNPVADGIPVWCVPPELQAESKNDLVPVPLTALKQQPPAQYLLGPGDVLGVFVERVLGQADQNPPVTLQESNGIASVAPALGFPIAVRDDGTLPLPLIDPVKVDGLTVGQAEKAVKEAYTVTKQFLAPGQARVLVTMMRPRTTRVLVVRQDSPGAAPTNVTVGAGYSRGLLGGDGAGISHTRRGTGVIVDLPAYQNDLLTALTQTGGLPGFDAKNEVVIERRSPKPASSLDGNSGADSTTMEAKSIAGQGVETVVIPLRLPRNTPLPFTPESIILHEGDVVKIEARDAEVFYTAGLLPPGEHTLPRDYDLDVVKAIAAVGGPMVNGGLNGNNLSGGLIAEGLGTDSPKLVSVLRKRPDGGQCTITVDLNCALQNPRKSLLIKPGDVIILQETTGQALVRYMTQVIHLSLTSNVIQSTATTGTTAVLGP